MEYAFPRYLLSKRSVDDRALNQNVLSALKENLPEMPLTVTEVGGGIGTMLARLLHWDVISTAEYTLVDEMAENINFAWTWLPEWAKEHGMQANQTGESQLHFFDEGHDLSVNLVQSDVFDFVAHDPSPSDILIAHAFLDLLPMPESLPKLFSLTKNLAWLTVNFDGLTSLEPIIDAELDTKVERLYHETMDTRPSGGDSQSGRHLFGHLKQVGVQIEAAGASDWVVYAQEGVYPADEAYFLHFILHFFEDSLRDHPELERNTFIHWLQRRREQVEQGELVYIAHQMDFLVKI